MCDVGGEVALVEDGEFAFLADAHVQGHFVEGFLGERGCDCLLRQFIYNTTLACIPESIPAETLSPTSLEQPVRRSPHTTPPHRRQ